MRQRCTRILSIREDHCASFSHTCTTTPCPTTGWPPVTWKGSGA
ncbi:unnamed protein product [Spirodela intermedia]|uniref:Uncharacterized protein n=1 Tax=Spirodela intermedia TaxID=51605 RepID=A0A7I8L430_SPIIN|nr:unnamed protein product [Spirodela intermedia]